MPPDPFTGIPADIQAFRDGWTEITDHGHPYEVVLAWDFSDDYLAQRICGTFKNMGDKVRVPDEINATFRDNGRKNCGTRNENPTLDRLRSSVKCMKGTGIMQLGYHQMPFVVLLSKTTPIKWSAVWKSKQGLPKLQFVKAELARKKHGSFVNRFYGDAVFNDCVPAANRYQVLHQALVTGFQHGVFVVCKLEEGQGSIVQIVVIKISTEQRDEYAENLCKKVVNPLLGFLHSEDVIARGILMDSDFPDWVTDPQRTILKTRAKLYYGHLKLISTEEGDLRPTKTVSIYKHSTQYRYNKHKQGLDMNTEISDRVAFHTTGPFEAKYVFRMLDAVMVNAWRAYQAVTVTRGYVR
ncbi:hypothetical protein IV203_007068 [Nitzschia inconspicua]|uniref:Uncharacterized protein n=1 Tax=Nitzschia inconspicua TaxID=303405 RepID=A0A9K3KEM1_9STRA|nr:hypothetical protein IV203_007068 [Nitzschia inconspicua]